jgi:2-hydroxy-3-keto-5-methylthiopentenyl-1-phosphate phosphatase
MNAKYKAMVSSDWNGCLAPCRPFDFISFAYPHLEANLAAVFRQYTGNLISLGEAAGQIRKLLPEPITPDQMDAYLDKSFTTYTGVPELIEWCASNNILFMINTTGMIGYFQRIFAKTLLPPVPVVSAHPMIRYPQSTSGSFRVYELLETRDKSKNTGEVARSQTIPARKILLLGDSGGDGPHFEWGAAIGAFLIGSMAKPSLDNYCRAKNIEINLRFGLDYSRCEKASLREELQIDFMDLTDTINEILNFVPAGPG